MSGWISVKDRLPDTDANVLVGTTDEYDRQWIDIGKYKRIYKYGWLKKTEAHEWQSDLPEVTHWMEIPELPREGQRVNWISVQERLPEKEEWVLITVRRANGSACVGADCYVDGHWAGANGSEDAVTHWMPMPKPAEE